MHNDDPEVGSFGAFARPVDDFGNKVYWSLSDVVDGFAREMDFKCDGLEEVDYE